MALRTYLTIWMISCFVVCACLLTPPRLAHALPLCSVQTCQDSPHSMRPSRPSNRKKTSPWVLYTPIPFGVSILGGIALIATGLGLQSAQQIDTGEAMTAGGASLLFAVASAYMWWKPSGIVGTGGTLLGLASLTTGVLVITRVVTSLSPASGWGFLAGSGVHLAFVIVGWINYNHLKKRERMSRPKRFRRAPYRHHRPNMLVPRYTKLSHVRHTEEFGQY